MEDLIDIQGLDYINWWPLAFGWWLVIAAVLICIGVTVFYLVRNFKYRRSWQYLSYKRLVFMQAQVGVLDHKEVLQRLSVEMRKIAMLTTKRESCAGLIGKKWLEWLQEHDPAGFDWQTNGAILVNVQYMPDLSNHNADDIAKLINAAQVWVKGGWSKKC